MKTACQYAILQFRPFAETGEFANVGIIVLTPERNYLDYRLAPKRFARITHFFHELDADAYKASLNIFEQEFKHLRNKFVHISTKERSNLIHSFEKYNESLIRFSNFRTIGTNNPEELADQLYDRYVGRDFITKKYREEVMVRSLRSHFTAKKLGVKYTKKLLDSGLRRVTIPLYSEVDTLARLIKPLAFEHNTTTKIIEHGEVWYNRAHSLISNNIVDPERVLFTVEGPKSTRGSLAKAYRDVLCEFKSLKINVLDFDERGKILSFAAGDLIDSKYILN